MVISNFDADIKIIATQEVFFEVLRQLIASKIDYITLKVDVELVPSSGLFRSTEWINTESWVNIIVNPSFILGNHNESSGYKIFVDCLLEFVNMLSDTKYSFPVISFIYYSENGKQHRFLVFDCRQNRILEMFNEFCDTVAVLLRNRYAKIQTKVKNTFVTSDNVIYWRYENNWKIIDPLLAESDKVNENYWRNVDSRVKKPWIVFYKEDIKEKKIIGENWSLEFDGLSTFMYKPNDVAMYSKISYSNLNLAKNFYNEHITHRFNSNEQSFPDVELQKLYFDYFELIITSVIFAYTALECFANICIPEEYEWFENKEDIRTIYTKTAIERKFSLRDKFKKIIREVLTTGDPSSQSWWNNFLKLEDLRNEIIHTKQSSSNSRYSKLLSKEVFHLIEVHKIVIQFYGYYISNNKPDLLDEFPYGFGFDKVEPGISDSLDFDLWVRNIGKKPYHRILADLDKARKKNNE